MAKELSQPALDLLKLMVEEYEKTGKEDLWKLEDLTKKANMGRIATEVAREELSNSDFISSGTYFEITHKAKTFAIEKGWVK